MLSIPITDNSRNIILRLRKIARKRLHTVSAVEPRARQRTGAGIGGASGTVKQKLFVSGNK